MATNRRVTLAARPEGFPKESDFVVDEVNVPGPGTGEVLVRVQYASVDPYQRGRMSEARSYAQPLEIGDVITSQGLGEGGGGIIPGADPHNPKTPDSIRQLLFDSNPWVKDADTDHHGYGLVSAKPAGFSCKLRRVDTVKRRSTTRLPDLAFTVRPGHPSLLS